MPLVSSGVEHGNLRELALARMRDLGTQVTCQAKNIFSFYCRIRFNAFQCSENLLGTLS